jgi:hypothetical protein
VTRVELDQGKGGTPKTYVTYNIRFRDCEGFGHEFDIPEGTSFQVGYFENKLVY